MSPAARALGAVAAALGLAIGTHARAQDALRHCTIEGQPARCGTISVPEDPRRPTGRQLALGVLVLSATGPGARREPVFLLAGGPGQAATSLADWAASLFEPVRRTRDIVLLDQRGSGGAQRLDCPRAPRTFFVAADPGDCIARLSRVAELSRYGTEDFVQDLELARRALGYDRIVLFGASYGTRAAYAYTRRYPAHVRAALLLAPAPISMPLLDSFAEDGRASLDAIVADCRADRACATAFPHLNEDLARFRVRTTEPYRLLGLQFLQYSSTTAAHIPALLTDVAHGRVAPLDSTIARFAGQLADQLALGLHLSIICGEDLPVRSGPGDSILRQQYRRACRGWPATPLSPRFHESVRLPIPALVLVGEWDPVTSPHWARVAAEQFAPAQLVIFRRAGHLLDGSNACLRAVIARFLERGAADPACAALAPRLPWALRAP